MTKAGPIPWAALEAFVAVAEHGGFSAAARALGVTASALSQAVQKLEQHSGATLFVRTTRSVRLTEPGRALYERVSPSLKSARTALDEVASDRAAVRGTLKLTMGRVAVPHVLYSVLPLLHAQHPELRVEVSIDDRFVDIVERGFDAGVRVSERIEPDLVRVRLTKPFRFVIVAAPSYLESRGRPREPRDLLEHECILWRLPTSGGIFRWRMQRGDRVEEVAVAGRVISDDSSLFIDLARRGLGLAYVAELDARTFCETGELEIVLPEWSPRVPGFFLYFPKSAASQPKLRAFIAAARAGLEGAPKKTRGRS